MTGAAASTTRFDAMPDADAAALLRSAFASDDWVAAMLAARPYPQLDRLLATSDRVVAALGWDAVLQALDGHPRIGDRSVAAETGELSREAGWSREEQAGVTNASGDVRDALTRGNVEYEQRFGHVFLICANGRSSEQMLGALHERLDNDVPSEQRIVRSELSAIARLRLMKALA